MYPSNEEAESVLVSTVATTKRVHSSTVPVLAYSHIVFEKSTEQRLVSKSRVEIRKLDMVEFA